MLGDAENRDVVRYRYLEGANSSTPTKGSKWNPRLKPPVLQGIPALYQAQNENVPIPGYLFSMDLEQEGTRRKVKPVWQVDVCVALPDDREFKKGGAAQ